MTKHIVMSEKDIPSEKDLQRTKTAFTMWCSDIKRHYGAEPQVSYDEWFELWMKSGKFFERKIDIAEDYAEYRWRMGVVDGNAPLVIDNMKVYQTMEQYLEDGTPVVNDIISDAYAEEEY